MGVIINPRGTSGAGKTELVRRILAEYGWERSGRYDDGSHIEWIHRAGRSRPFGCRLKHPLGGRDLVVLGHYEATSGGCDTIRVRDGGIGEITRRAAEYASSGNDVIIEGLLLSSEIEFSAELARSHRLHVLRLNTPLDQCVRNLVTRRRARRDDLAFLQKKTSAEHRTVDEACERLRPHATVEVLAFDDALARVRNLLAIPDFRTAC